MLHWNFIHNIKKTSIYWGWKWTQNEVFKIIINGVHWQPWKHFSFSTSNISSKLNRNGASTFSVFVSMSVCLSDCLSPPLCFSTLYDFYHYFYMVTNVLFYVSSAINPVLYNLVSTNYRQIFFSTLHNFCLPCRRKKQTRMLTRHSISICSSHTFSTNVIKETVYWSSLTVIYKVTAILAVLLQLK